MGCCTAKKTEHYLYRLNNKQIDVINKLVPEYMDISYILLKPIYFTISDTLKYKIASGFCIHGGRKKNDTMNVFHDFIYATHMISKESVDALVNNKPILKDYDDWNYCQKNGALYLCRYPDSETLLILSLHKFEPSGDFIVNRETFITNPKDIKLFDDFFIQCKLLNNDINGG